MNDDVIVYDGGRDYVAMFGDEGQWFKWPAKEGGWKERAKCSASSADNLPELPNGQLALRLSGAE